MAAAYETRRMRLGRPRQDAGRAFYERVGPWMVTVTDKRGRRMVWRSGLPWNVAQRFAKNARRANYRNVRIVRMGKR